jgi:nucleotidyltransferase substrate binding protein (TIGR01987 family)
MMIAVYAAWVMFNGLKIIMNTLQTPRWIFRFDNFKRAFALLRDAINDMQQREISQLEKEGIIQRFEYTWELAWKVLKDYLEYTGVILETITPAAVIKAAFAAKIIDHGELWMQAMDARNKMPHTYNLKIFELIIGDIQKQYLQLLEDLHNKMLGFIQVAGDESRLK